MSDDDSESDSDGLIWDFGSPNIPEELRRKFVETKETKRKKRKADLWPSPHSIKVALDKSLLNNLEPLHQVQNEPLEAIRSEIKKFRERLDAIVQESKNISTEDINSTKKFECSGINGPPHKKMKIKCDASILNDSIDEDSLSLCSQLVESKFINDNNHYKNLSAKGLGASSSTNEVASSGVSVDRTVKDVSRDQPAANQSSFTTNLLDDDEDFFLNESLSYY